MNYFVVMIEYGKSPRNGIGPCGREASVDPEMTRRGAIDLVRENLRRGHRIAFVHHITMNDVPQDVTDEFLHCADWGDHETEATPLAAKIDHMRDLRKHEVA